MNPRIETGKQQTIKIKSILKVSNAPLTIHNINSISTSVSSPTSLIQPATFPSIPDTGCSGHYFPSGTPISNMRPDTPSTSLQVHLPNGATIQSSHSGQIDLPDLPPAAKESHIFPDLSAASLLSVGQLCNSGCKVTFTNKEVNVMLHDKNILSGVRTPHNGLWSIDLPAAQVASTVPTSAPSIPPTHTPSSPSQELNLLTTPQLVCQLVTTSVTQTIADRVAFYHASLFSPTISTWCRAIDAGHLTTWPELTAKQVRAHLPKSIAMLKGHLDQTRANAQSTRPTIHVPRSLMPAAAAACITAEDLAEAFDSHPPSMEGPADVPGQRTHYMYAAIHDAKGQIFTDQPGRFLVASSAGNSYMLVLYDYDSNHIHAEPMPSRTAKSIVDAYTRAHVTQPKARVFYFFGSSFFSKLF